jgi:RNA recognition motif-containing protein
VFDLFHRFGRLAQISLKSAYGFVQYHSAQDAEAAMQSAQGAELGGRKIRKFKTQICQVPGR